MADGRKWQEDNRVKASLWCSAFLCFLTLAKGTTTRTINNGPEQEQQEPEARTRTIWCQGAPHRTCNGVGRVRGASFSNNLGAPPQSCAPNEIQEDTSRLEMLKSLLLVENHFQKIHSNLQYSSSWVYLFRIFFIIFVFQALASVFLQGLNCHTPHVSIGVNQKSVYHRSLLTTSNHSLRPFFPELNPTTYMVYHLHIMCMSFSSCPKKAFWCNNPPKMPKFSAHHHLRSSKIPMASSEALATWDFLMGGTNHGPHGKTQRNS